MDQVRAMIASSRLRTGEMLPSVRQLSAELQVNMMTVSKAYARLEAEGFIERVRGTGMRILTQRKAGSVSDRQEALRELVKPLITRALQLGLSESQIISVVRETLEDRRSWSKT
ncbi:GntR family transcriptional regulator [bacterium]|nr:GntR family transcriptional regulator [bacterium]